LESLDVPFCPKGEIVSNIGANGAGKFALLKGVAGLKKTQRGRSFYKDRDIAGAAG
jgi:ABC-type branched-subunit amino acid transport system ATPase component